MDLKTRETTTWCEAECYPSEPVFVPAPEAKVGVFGYSHISRNASLYLMALGDGSDLLILRNFLGIQEEDDGVLLSALVFGGDRSNAVALLVLDAKTFEELGRAEFVTPSPAPKCLHGWFLPDRA